MSSTSSWALLGLKPDTPHEEVRRKYKRLALQWHPDKNPGKQARATEKMIELQRAYEKVVKDIELRSGPEQRGHTMTRPPASPWVSSFTYTRPKVYTDWYATAREARRPKRKEKPKPGPKPQKKSPLPKSTAPRPNPSEQPRESATQSSAEDRPPHLTFDALSKLCKDAIGSAVLAEARAETFAKRYRLGGRVDHHVHMSFVHSKGTVLRTQAEATHSQLKNRFMECVGTTNKWWEEVDHLERVHNEMLVRSRQASQLKMWLGELSDSCAGDLSKALVEAHWSKELEAVQRIAEFAQLTREF